MNQLDLFKETPHQDRAIRYGNIIIWNYTYCDIERLDNCGIKWEPYVEKRKLLLGDRKWELT